MTIKFPTLADPFIFVLIIAIAISGCSMSKDDVKEHCLISCKRCDDLIVKCGKNSKEQKMGAGPTTIKLPVK